MGRKKLVQPTVIDLPASLGEGSSKQSAGLRIDLTHGFRMGVVDGSTGIIHHYQADLWELQHARAMTGPSGRSLWKAPPPVFLGTMVSSSGESGTVADFLRELATIYEQGRMVIGQTYIKGDDGQLTAATDVEANGAS